MSSRDRLRQQKLDAARLQNAWNQTSRREDRNHHSPNVEVGGDSAIDAMHQFFEIVRPARGAPENGNSRQRALDNIDFQEEQKEQNHHRREAEQSPEDFPCERLAKRVADQGHRRGHLSTTLKNTSSSVLEVGITFSIQHFSARSRSMA